MPRCTSPQPYTGSSGSNYGSLHYPPPQSDDRLRRLMLHDVSAPAESAVATDAFSVAAVSTSDGMSVILTGATARPKASHTIASIARFHSVCLVAPLQACGASGCRASVPPHKGPRTRWGTSRRVSGPGRASGSTRGRCGAAISAYI